MLTNNPLYWLILIPAGYFPINLAHFLYVVRSGQPQPSIEDQDEANESPTRPTTMEKHESPNEIDQMVAKLQSHNCHVEVTRLNGKIAVMFDPADLQPRTSG